MRTLRVNLMSQYIHEKAYIPPSIIKVVKAAIMTNSLLSSGGVLGVLLL